ncbi:MAG: thermonuclease family protein [Actinobacteria bacterium]|nr:thermonuclease family protein [Actinomycetota bacterium]
MTARQARTWVVLFVALVALGYGLIKPAPSEVTNGDQIAGGEDTTTTDDAAFDSDGSGSDGRDSGDPADAADERRAVVLRVVDGDTILVRILGAADRPTRRTERVRYIGVDTPESVKPGAPVDCYGKEAAAFNRSLVDGRRVRMVPDREPRDRYGRTLAFVYLEDEFVNAELVKNGFARTLEIEPNTSKAGYLARLERVAIRTNRGLWGACDR